MKMIKNRFLKLIGTYAESEAYNSDCWNEIEKNYTSKSRHYHNLKHLEHMLNELDKVHSQVKDVDTLLFAIYYHDIIYKPTKSDNEHQSALLFEKRISPTSFSNITACMTQIELTKEHQRSSDNDTNILLDLDLSILGQTTEEYQQYCKNIRKEYQIYPYFMYRKGRKKVLKHMLALESIYKTSFFKHAYENQARENLRRELSQLGA